MEFLEKNKRVIVPAVFGALIGLVLGALDVPEWLIGAAVAALVVLGAGKMLALYDEEVAPRLNARRKER